MALNRGATLGHYEIVALIGRGGMGEVYKARDTRLDRLVAIKVITGDLAGLDDARRRFEDECRVTATLHHPRICAVYDVGSTDGVLYLVMEFLDGKSLADRITHGPIQRSELLGHAIEIADAVHYAHRHGVVHRDLKPANVFITSSGVKVLDFGIAKVRHADDRPVTEGATERTAAPRTVRGPVFGTMFYLPPERLEGKPADHRSDVYGFGTILYEMATGRRAFDAPTPAGVIAAVIATEAAPIGAESAVADLDWVVRRCLAKDPDDRWQSLGDVEATLKSIARRSGIASGGPAPGLARRGRGLALLTGAAIVAALAAASGLYRARQVPVQDAAAVSFDISPPRGHTFTQTEGTVGTAQLAVSRDGREVAFVASARNGASQIWIRPLGSVDAVPVPGTDGASFPFWSPDGHSLGFFVDNALKRIDRRGGPARPLALAQNGRGGSWNDDGIILFSADTNAGITRVRDDGTGRAEQTAVETANGEVSHRWPQFLPDGNLYLLFVQSTDPERGGIYLASLSSPQRTRLVSSTHSGQYAPPGRLLYVLGGTLLAVQLDVTARRVIGEPVFVTKDVGTSSNFYSAVSASATGILAHAGRAVIPEELAWLDRSGRRVGTAATNDRFVDFRLSPDARQVAVSTVKGSADKTDISVLNLGRAATLRLTTSPATDASPVWSADGTHILFRSNREGPHQLFIVPLSDPGSSAPFVKSDRYKHPTGWTRSGLILYHTNNKDTGWDIGSALWPRPGTPRLLVKTEFNESQAQVSPDERWLAYTSDQSGLPEVYVQPLSGTGGRVPVSFHGATDPHWLGAADPRWRGDGRELFYVTADGTVMGVAFPGDGRELGQPTRLFNIAHTYIAEPFNSAYDPAADGKRFLVRIRHEDARAVPLTVMLNWMNR